MLDPKLIAELDQASQGISEAFPPMLWNFYSALLLQGFSEPAALQLAGVLLHSILTKPPTPGE